MTRVGGASSKQVTLETGDIQIGAVEIKNSTDDTRATVGSNGLYVDIRSTIPNSSKYSTNAIDDYTTASTTYICKEAASTADWYIMKIDETGNFPLFTYATVVNNPTVTTYSDAFTARATTLVYGNYNTAF